MKGEIGIKVSHIEFDVESNGNRDFKIVDENGEFLYIVGDNNWDDLFENAIRNVEQKHINEVVDCHYYSYEFKKDGAKTGHFARAIILKKHEYGKYRVYFLHDGTEKVIHGDWLFSLKHNEYLSEIG